uniref:Helicase-associated domain-containing protein n=1 Tax=Entomoneis paludosa TaxID=265537 RepID=A0A7S3DW66_9STRA|mmetsp:Transcript_4140/g.8888  ORF Transcript_4140/g.8888 Transcript_4140/m.8888 type:complete len:456 (+) Transcript_4140:383-1750(+)|eukprot:CAMPEP_0172452622 /NCGR_PEP_ID=MMETSP1065-20121228/10228_1 /TAXON_ID=265537 /ORGANISM="Amphiprora paludosa, Strain CCMP125" /LENGTH=455 /DNA_ID=CAMNT_0013204707 /DNA_START=231 /DNA_END=1598 /DNA_ORIENTATION=-
MGKTLPWKTKLAALQKFKELEGHTMVRQNYVDPESGFRLGRWVANLRQRADFLTDSQLADLERLDFVWSRFKVLPWDMKIDILRKYTQKHGHSLVPKDYVDTDSGFHLGWWVDRMRQGKNTMNQARIRDLEALGFVWNAFDATWETMFLLLQEYKQEYHHACPKISEHYKGKPLGHWVGMQRQLYARKQRNPELQQQLAASSSASSVASNAAGGATTVISEKRIQLLESIGFVWRLRTSGAFDMDDGISSSTEASSMTGGSEYTATPASPATSAQNAAFSSMISSMMAGMPHHMLTSATTAPPLTKDTRSQQQPQHQLTMNHYAAGVSMKQPPADPLAPNPIHQQHQRHYSHHQQQLHQHATAAAMQHQQQQSQATISSAAAPVDPLAPNPVHHHHATSSTTTSTDPLAPNPVDPNRQGSTPSPTTEADVMAAAAAAAGSDFSPEAGRGGPWAIL